MITAIHALTGEKLTTSIGDLGKFLFNSILPGQTQITVTQRTWDGLNALQGNCKCGCSRWFTPSYGEFKRCPDCLTSQHAAAESATGVE